MTHLTRATALLLVVPVVFASGCGGPSDADREVCDAATDLTTTGFSTDQAQQRAIDVLRELSGYSPDEDRLVRAVERARDDAQAIIDAYSPYSFSKIEGGVAALNGSLPAIQEVCEDLGT